MAREGKMSFKVGDKVTTKVCINGTLTLDKIYEIVSINAPWYRIIDDTGTESGWSEDRFQLVTSSQTTRMPKFSNSMVGFTLPNDSFQFWDVLKNTTQTDLGTKKCTCGTKISMGVSYHIDHCSSWCDLRGKT